ncbi:MAG: hypothetical protein AB7E81_19795 [Hyphomicrobiaceae bacterium]
MLAGIARDRDHELVDVVVIEGENDLTQHAMLDHARLIVGSVLRDRR